MIKQIENYLDLIFSEIKESYSNEINFDNSNFKNFSVFDFVNFHLINKYIISDNTKDLFLSIPEDDYRENFFYSIFQSLVYIKLYQNYFNYEKIQPELEKGDLIYLNSRKRVFEVISNYNNSLRVNFKFPKPNEIGIQPIPFTSWNFTKINPKLSNGRNTARNIDNYSSFLKESFDETFPFITDFSNRSLVIADQQFFRESKHLPIRYTNRNGIITNDLPFFNYMIECCNNFETAQNYLLNTNQKFDEIIIIADSKYINNFDTIIQETKVLGKVKNIILIGTEKPNTPNEFIDWLWSNDEVKIANNETPNIITKIPIENENLFNLLVELKKEIETIKYETKVNLKDFLNYTNFYFRTILVNSNLSKGIFEEYKERLQIYFKSDAFEQKIKTQFYQKDIYNPEDIIKYTNRIQVKFDQISTILETENLKWNYIKNKSKEVNQIYLVVEKKVFDAVKNQLKNERINNIKLISDKRIDSEIDYLDKWIKSSKNSINTNIIISYLNNYELYKKLKSIKGNCDILCYKDIDEIAFDNLVCHYDNKESKRLSHKDRLTFFNTDFKFSNEIKKRELDDLFNLDIENKEVKDDSYELNELPKQKVTYEIQFSDETLDKFDSSKGVFLIEKNEQIKISIGEIYEGATIRFYQNTSQNEFRKVLKILDSDNLLSSFDSYSESWKTTLRNLKCKYGTIENLYENLFDSNNKINFNTFRLYFDKDSHTRFTRIKTLEVIKNFCISNGFSNELLVVDFEKFKVYSRKDSTIRQQAGRIIGSDLLDYIASNKTEISDSLKKLSSETLEKLTETIQEKTVTKKILLEDE